MNILNVGYDSTNYYVIGNTTTKLLIDVGWPGTLPKLLHTLKRKGIHIREIEYLVITHYHPDHAGLAQEVKRQGVKLVVLENQIQAIPALRQTMKPDHHYIEIDLSDNIHLAAGESRAFLSSLLIEGEIISTPGHTEDSITVILDDRVAFTGDLPHLPQVAEDSMDQAKLSWEKIRRHNVKTIYPGHGPSGPAE
jgi:glyoxylase-like metal-dependent hydrolase (beta-lactamase superfamily II)